MYGQTRMTVLDRTVSGISRAARVGRIAVHLLSTRRLRPTDVYAAVMTARFMAAHELIDKAGDHAEAGGPDVEVTQIRQPAWFGGGTIHEETKY